MFKALAVSMFLLLGAITVSAQKVEVTQGFVDDANRAFNEVVALRAVKAAHEAKDEVERDRDKIKDELILALRKQLEIRDEQIETYRKIKCDKTSYVFGLIKSTRCN